MRLQVVMAALVLTGILTGCSFDTTIAGNSAETGNPRIVGKVFDDRGHVAANRTVMLSSHAITEHGDTTIFRLSAHTDTTGSFFFDFLEPGRYVAYCNDMNANIQAIQSKVHISAADDSTPLTLRLTPGVCLKGRIHPAHIKDPESVTVFIPGIETATRPDGQGWFVLKNVPVGHYDLTFVFGTTVNYLPLSVHLSATDTIFIGEVTLTSVPDLATIRYSFYPSELPTTLALSPAMHVERPDTSSVVYYAVAPDASIMPAAWPGKPLWRFGLVVGVHDNTVDAYGGFEAIRDSISLHLQRINAKFNTPDVFNGTFRFAMDSLYRYSDPTSSHMVTPPTGFDYRLVINRFETDIAGGYWSGVKTIGHFPPATFTGGMFDRSRADIANFMCAQARGARNLRRMFVLAERNPVSGTGWCPDSAIMLYPYGVNTWDRWNINIINYHADKAIETPDICTRAFPKSISVSLRTAKGAEVPGAQVSLFSVQDSAVLATPLISVTTNTAGVIFLATNPFLNPSTGSIARWNLLVRATSATDTAFAWMPISEVNNAWFANPDTLYGLTLELN